MLINKFKEFLILSAKLRREYPASLGVKSANWLEILSKIDTNVPELYNVIYSSVSGTQRDITNQTLMDFIPGYRLIHIEELFNEKQSLDSVLSYYDNIDGLTILPVLANYSSDFICYCRDQRGIENICRVNHDDDLIILHKSPEKFLETICEFYKQGVFFLEGDGYLDYDMEKEGQIGLLFNPGVAYWFGE